MEVLRPDTRIGPEGRFVIRNLVGTGGMGQVYRALDSVMKREVAIKTLHKDLVAGEPQYAERFLNEAIAAGGIAHQHVVKIHDYGVHEGQPYIVMEYLQGKSLSAVALEAPLPIDRAVDIVLSACSAVYFCHRHKIFHRDLKPSNIFLVDTEDRDFDHVIVLDFGVAKIATQPDLTKAGSLMGTPSFLAPESITAKNADPQSDQYSLGVLLYYSLTRKLPFRAPSDYELWQAIRSGVYKSPRELRPEVPLGLEEVVRQAMNVDPAARFPNVHMFGRALLPFGSPAGRRHWSTLFTAAPRPVKDPSPSMAIIVPPIEPQATAVDLTRTRAAERSGTMDPVPTVPERAVKAPSSISISISGVIDGEASGDEAANRAPPEPLEPPPTPAAFAVPRPNTRARILNPRLVAAAAALVGVAVVGIAISVASRSPSRTASPSAPIPATVAPPAVAPPAPAAAAPVTEVPAAPQTPPAAALPVAPTDTATPNTASERPQRADDGKRRRHPRRVPRDENGFPIIE
jgi:eukaryotic-like serine/threonine-protein kinase